MSNDCQHEKVTPCGVQWTPKGYAPGYMVNCTGCNFTIVVSRERFNESICDILNENERLRALLDRVEKIEG